MCATSARAEGPVAWRLMSYRILIIDDEPDLVAALEHALQREGFVTAVANTGRQALTLAMPPCPDLILLDVVLPDMPGTQVCLHLRGEPATRAVPIIMMSARATEIDRVVGFEVGADDYVAKPFSMRELILRIRAVLQRCAPDSRFTGAIDFAQLRIDTAAHRAWVDGVDISLTALEFRLLVLLFERRGRVQTREALLEAVWGAHALEASRTIDTTILRLRKKLGDAGGYLRTVRGVGFRFVADPDEEPG